MPRGLYARLCHAFVGRFGSDYESKKNIRAWNSHLGRTTTTYQWKHSVKYIVKKVT